MIPLHVQLVRLASRLEGVALYLRAGQYEKAAGALEDARILLEQIQKEAP